MAKPKKSSRSRKQADARKSTAPRVSRTMAGVRPLNAAPAIGRSYDPGFRAPGKKNPWVDEGEPEVNG